jgi:hypothetical protein
MCWKKLAVLALSLFLCLARAHASEIDHSKGWGGMDGSDLLPMCQAEVEMQDGKTIPIDRMADAMHCANYLQGFLDGFVMGQLVPGATQVLCFPESVNMAQMTRIVAKWLHYNPARLHEPAYGLVFVATRDAFACQSTPTGQQSSSPPSEPPGSMEDTKPSTENGKQELQRGAKPSVSENSLEALEDAQLIRVVCLGRGVLQFGRLRVCRGAIQESTQSTLSGSAGAGTAPQRADFFTHGCERHVRPSAGLRKVAQKARSRALQTLVPHATREYALSRNRPALTNCCDLGFIVRPESLLPSE